MTVFVYVTWNFVIGHKTTFSSPFNDGFYFQEEISSINLHKNGINV